MSEQLATSKEQEEIERAKDLVIQAITETMDVYGAAPSVGRLYATMYFVENPITLDEMKDMLEMSKPSMSTGVRALQENGMVNRIWEKGSRKNKYAAEKDFFKSFIRFYCKRWEREYKENLRAIADSQRILQEIMEDDSCDESIRTQAEEYYYQVEDSKRYYRWLERLVESFYSQEIFRHIPKEDL
ncbi:DNA-binding transcriptional regulator GbsR, MarR family [Tindallia magadiensis]|uniref:HTH-type transcriptional regulator n=1 Tax=Tindallia magadiensis TaxID=69895 RepID=A0A1I3EMG4_9FIRM|nr:GbsR/MarR family transcriptional regulator [Tindallia magadiensis]SFI00142.1 DNA-binding transcriptional regulator GbsR, MarR family [Tindallia magadiensis]